LCCMRPFACLNPDDLAPFDLSSPFSSPHSLFLRFHVSRLFFSLSTQIVRPCQRRPSVLEPLRRLLPLTFLLDFPVFLCSFSCFPPPSMAICVLLRTPGPRGAVPPRFRDDSICNQPSGPPLAIGRRAFFPSAQALTSRLSFSSSPNFLDQWEKFFGHSHDSNPRDSLSSLYAYLWPLQTFHHPDLLLFLYVV